MLHYDAPSVYRLTDEMSLGACIRANEAVGKKELGPWLFAHAIRGSLSQGSWSELSHGSLGSVSDSEVLTRSR